MKASKNITQSTVYVPMPSLDLLTERNVATVSLTNVPSWHGKGNGKALRLASSAKQTQRTGCERAEAE